MSVVAEFASTAATQSILARTKQLKGTNNYVERDLTPKRQEQKRLMLTLRSEILAVSSANESK